MILPEIDKMTCSGVYSFINDEDKCVFIMYSSYVLESVYRNILGLVRRDHANTKLADDFSKLRFEILETGNFDDFELRLLSSRYKEIYKNKGYSLYNPHIPLKVRFKEELLEYDGKPLIALKLVSIRRIERVIGLFESNQELKEFKALYYPDDTNIRIPIVTANNDVTRLYLENNGMDIQMYVCKDSN